MSNSIYIGGRWVSGEGDQLVSTSPLDDSEVWSAKAASTPQVEAAVQAARDAHANWSKTSLDDRIGLLNRYAELVTQHKEELGDLIHREMGKPLAEAVGEAGAVAGKVQLTIDALRERRSEQTIDMGGKTGRTWYKSLGVVGVLGPFNFPMHLANGHIVPALLSGNTVVFKPSELTPACGERMVKLFEQAGLPSGCLNLVQGGGDIGKALADDDLDGLFFTGGSHTGLRLHRALANSTRPLLALELGGNNPIVVHEPADVEAAANIVAESAFVTAGQRCTCARRLIVTGSAELLLEALKVAAQRYAASVVARRESAESMMKAQADWLAMGATEILLGQSGKGPTPCYVTPGIIDTTGCDIADEEVFGPLLQVRQVANLDEAISEANRTAYGLAAGIVTASDDAWQQFRHGVRAGIINRNSPITGASGKLPFGGVGLSGNHRPSGYFAIDYCSDAVASVEA